MNIPFTKLHGIGNDYIYLSGLPDDKNFIDLTGIDISKLAREMSRRHFGVGADGIIIILPSDQADFKMRMFNSDGSEAEMCGNGLRGFAKYLFDRNLINNKTIRIETEAGLIVPEIIEEKDGQAVIIRVDMGSPVVDSKDIPVKSDKDRLIDERFNVDGQDIYITCISMGNPHCVIFVDRGEEIVTKSGHKMYISTAMVRKLGPKIETHKIFPNGINVHFSRVIENDELEMRTWERGSGETLACGTGACAVLVASVLNKKSNKKTTIHLLGGDLIVEWVENDRVYLTGPAEETFEGIYCY